MLSKNIRFKNFSNKSKNLSVYKIFKNLNNCLPVFVPALPSLRKGLMVTIIIIFSQKIKNGTYVLVSSKNHQI